MFTLEEQSRIKQNKWQVKLKTGEKKKKSELYSCKKTIQQSITAAKKRCTKSVFSSLEESEVTRVFQSMAHT